MSVESRTRRQRLQAASVLSGDETRLLTVYPVYDKKSPQAVLLPKLPRFPSQNLISRLFFFSTPSSSSR